MSLRPDLTPAANLMFDIMSGRCGFPEEFEEFYKTAPVPSVTESSTSDGGLAIMALAIKKACYIGWCRK